VTACARRARPAPTSPRPSRATRRRHAPARARLAARLASRSRAAPPRQTACALRARPAPTSPRLSRASQHRPAREPALPRAALPASRSRAAQQLRSQYYINCPSFATLSNTRIVFFSFHYSRVCSPCAAGTFQASALSGSTTQACSGTCTASSCGAGNQIVGCTATADRVCTQCAAGTYEATGLSGYLTLACSSTCSSSYCAAGQQITGCTPIAESVHFFSRCHSQDYTNLPHNPIVPYLRYSFFQPCLLGLHGRHVPSHSTVGLHDAGVYDLRCLLSGAADQL